VKIEGCMGNDVVDFISQEPIVPRGTIKFKMEFNV